MKANQNGFSIVEGILILAIVGLIGGVGYFVYNSQRDINKSLNNATNASSESVTSKYASSLLSSISDEAEQIKDGILIITPKNNATVSQTFSIEGTAPKEEAGTALSIYIDNDSDRYYKTVAPVNSDGTFSISVDLTGTNVVQHVPNVTEEDATVTYKAVGSGKHTFHITYDGSQSAPKADGPTLTLIVQ